MVGQELFQIFPMIAKTFHTSLPFTEQWVKSPCDKDWLSHLRHVYHTVKEDIIYKGKYFAMYFQFFQLSHLKSQRFILDFDIDMANK